MKSMNFLIGSVCWIQYFIPIVIEGNKRNIQSHFFLRENRKKYANPYLTRHYKQVRNVCTEYKIIMHDLSEVINYPGLTFMLEGDLTGTSREDFTSAGIFALNKLHLKVSLSFNADFIWSYSKYIDFVDYCILPNQIYAKTYKTLSNKNLYIGSPKFDINFDKNEIYKKYNLGENDKYCLFFYPKRKWWDESKILKANKIKFAELFLYLKQMGYKIIVKTREKDSLEFKKGDYYFEDLALYPNSSIELLQITDLAIFFSSTTIEECVMYNVPFIDFKVDPNLDRFSFLNHSAYSRIVANFAINYPTFRKHVNMITDANTLADRTKAFEKVREKYLFEGLGSSGKIIDYFKDTHNALVDKATDIYNKMKQAKEIQEKANEIELQKIEKSNPVLKKIYDRRKKLQEKFNEKH